MTLANLLEEIIIVSHTLGQIVTCNDSDAWQP